LWEKTIIFTRKKLFWSDLRLIFGYVFEIKFVKMRKSAIPAPDGKVPAADRQVVGTGDMAVPAFGCLDKFPEIVTANLRIRSFFPDILDPGNEDPGSPAVVADHLGLVWHSPDDLVGIFFTVIAVRTVPREDEPVGHGR
jgi:hypothetical protein